MNDRQSGATESQIIALRKEKLNELRKKGLAYVNDFKRNILASLLLERFGQLDEDALENTTERFNIAGRIMTKRVMGKASFAHLKDMSGQIQIYVTRDNLGEEGYAEFKKWDLGDIVGVIGSVFRTNKGELSINVKSAVLLSKSLRPLPEKWHGLADTETRYRQRYLDLIMNQDAFSVFKTRSKVVELVRKFLKLEGYLEVETPMMHPIPGGANAKPFITKHNSLDMDLYLRIAPELYLKRLVVGGFEKVFEINRSFRNEGLSTRHNPEFTMLEFYEAYATFEDLMLLTEELLKNLVKEVLGTDYLIYQEKKYSFAESFEKLTMVEAVKRFNPTYHEKNLQDMRVLSELASQIKLKIEDGWGEGKILAEIFEKTCEPNLEGPVFITHYPSEVSPLARNNNDDPFFCDRFEFFVAGREIANGFSELNDPEDQAQRFSLQLEDKAKGDDEAMHFDSDYIKALEYGMPPTAGEGIGIDRLTMLLTDSPSIRDVLLFPQMRPNQ